jgi:hypothetical protein
VNHIPEKVPLNFGDGQEIPDKLVSASNDFHQVCMDVETVRKHPELTEVLFDNFKCPFFRTPNKVESLPFEAILAHEESNHQKLFDLFEVMILDHLHDLAFVSVNHENKSASEFMEEKLWHCGGTDKLLQLGNDPILMQDMDRLLNHTEFLNDSIINAICNHANALYFNRLQMDSSSGDDRKSLPKNIILSTYALEAINIMPKSKKGINHIHLLNKQKLSPKDSEKSDVDPDEFESEVVHWYALQQFGELARVLHHYAESNVMPSRMLCVFNVKHGFHWTAYDIDMAASCIREYDSMDHSKCTIHAITPWLAKLLGLYRYQIGGLGPMYYGSNDMNLQDNEPKEPRRNIKNQIENVSFSFEPAQGDFPFQSDGVSCGVFAMYYVLCGLFDVTPNPQVSTEDVRRLRESVGLFFIRSAHLSRPLLSKPDDSWILPLLQVDPEIASQNQSGLLKKTYRKRNSKSAAAAALSDKTSDGKGHSLNPIVLPSTPKGMPIISKLLHPLSSKAKITSSSSIVTRKSRTAKLKVDLPKDKLPPSTPIKKAPHKEENESPSKSTRSSTSTKKKPASDQSKSSPSIVDKESLKQIEKEPINKDNESEGRSMRSSSSKKRTVGEGKGKKSKKKLNSAKRSSTDEMTAAREEAEALLAKIANHVDKTKAEMKEERKQELQRRKNKRKEDQMDGELMWAWEQCTRQLKNNTYLNPADRLCNNKNNLCRSEHKTVVKECCHVIGSRIIYPYARVDTPTLIHSQMKELGCLYKEITLGQDDPDSHCVGSVMVYERNLQHMSHNAVMIKSISTAIECEGQGLGSSFFMDLCDLHHSGTTVLAMVMPQEYILDPNSKKRKQSRRKKAPEDEPSSMSFFSKYGFKLSPRGDNFCIDDNFIETNCIIMWTTIASLKNRTYKKLGENVRTLDIDPKVVHEMRWNPTKNCFQGLNIHFQGEPIVIDPKLCDGISRHDFQNRKQMKENHMKYRKLRPGNRASEKSSNNNCELSSGITMQEIRPEFKGVSYDSGECLWAAAAMLIFTIHEDSGLSMMRMHEQFPNDFQWISMYTNRASKRTSQVTKESNRFCLVDLLCRNTDFNLLKVKHQNGEYGNFEFIQNIEKGHFVCNLKNQNGFLGHCVGVSKTSRDNGLIFDCRETHVLPFTLSNLNRCVGMYSKCISIPHIGQICYKRGKGNIK